MKAIVKMIVVAALPFAAGHAAAQHVPEAEKYRISTQGGQQALPPPQPTGYWEKTWGAIAPSPKEAALGTAVGSSSKEEAERVALADCQAKGGGECKVQMSYQNQCAVMVIGDKFLGTASALTIEEASNIGIKNCNRSDTNCRVYYSACTKPIFHKY